LYAPGFTSPNGAGVYSFYDVPNGIKPIEIIVDEITHREQKTFNLDLYYNYSNADLSNLVFEKQVYTGSEWIFEPQAFGFNPTQEEYNIDLPAQITNTRISAVTSVPGASVKVKVNEDPYNNLSGFFNFSSAPVYTEVFVQVTAMDGVTTKTYKLNIRRPMPEGLSVWTSRNNSNQRVHWSLVATSGSNNGYFKANTLTPTAALDMKFTFASGSPATDYVEVQKLTGVANDDLSHASSGSLFGTPWISDTTGTLQLTGLTPGYNYYVMKVYTDSTPTPIIHYLEIYSF